MFSKILPFSVSRTVCWSPQATAVTLCPPGIAILAGGRQLTLRLASLSTSELDPACPSVFDDTLSETNKCISDTVDNDLHQKPYANKRFCSGLDKTMYINYIMCV